MVGGDHGHAGRGGGADRAAADEEVRLGVHDVGVDAGEQRRHGLAVRHGGQIRNVGWNGVRTEPSRWTVTPSTASVSAAPLGDGQRTWTSCPRAASPDASRWAKFAAPLTSGGKVSAPMTSFMCVR